MPLGKTILFSDTSVMIASTAQSQWMLKRHTHTNTHPYSPKRWKSKIRNTVPLVPKYWMYDAVRCIRKAVKRFEICNAITLGDIRDISIAFFRFFTWGLILDVHKRKSHELCKGKSGPFFFSSLFFCSFCFFNSAGKESHRDVRTNYKLLFNDKWLLKMFTCFEHFNFCNLQNIIRNWKSLGWQTDPFKSNVLCCRRCTLISWSLQVLKLRSLWATY